MTSPLITNMEERKKERADQIAQKTQEMEEKDQLSATELRVKKEAGKLKVHTIPPTTEEIAQALENKMGFIAHAAQVLGWSTTWLLRRIKNDPDLQEQLNDIRNIKLDFAESQLEKLIKGGNLTAIIYFLKCKGSDRGWNNDNAKGDTRRDEKPAVFNINFAAKVKKEEHDETD